MIWTSKFGEFWSPKGRQFDLQIGQGYGMVPIERACHKDHACQDKKEEIWPSPMTKAPIPTEMSKGQSDNTINVTKKFD